MARVRTALVFIAILLATSLVLAHGRALLQSPSEEGDDDRDDRLDVDRDTDNGDDNDDNNNDSNNNNSNNGDDVDSDEGSDNVDDDSDDNDDDGNFLCRNNIGLVTTVFPGTGAGALNQTYSVEDNRCTHFYRGYDITGVANQFNVVDGVETSCDCIKECVARIGVCSAWVWKFTGNANDKRTCTLYSQFNLPPQVTIVYDNTAGNGATLGIVSQEPQNNDQFGYIQEANLKQEGSRVPRCTNNDGTGFDQDCRSGSVFLLDSGIVVC